MIRQKKVLLIWTTIPAGLYLCGFWLNWKAALSILAATLLTMWLSQVWRDATTN